jgi:hypothetical protein
MFKIEIHERTVQDNLPAEIRRELQVEELWARRTVLANRMNAERLNLYASRRALLWPDNLAFAVAHLASRSVCQKEVA